MSAAILSGCSQKASDEIDFGTLDNSSYSNRYFGFSVTLPKDWSVQDQKSQQRLSKRGAQLIAGDDQNLKAIVKASEMQTVNLLAAFEHPLGAPVDFNPSIACVAERVREMPGITRGRDYLFQARKMLESGKMQISFPRDYSTEQIGGLNFDLMETELHISGRTVQQKYYASIKKGYALCFILSFANPDQAGALQNILNTIAFK